MSNLTLNINLSNTAISQFCEFSHNSYATIAGKQYGANDAGIFELTGNTDKDANIDAWFELVVSDFGIPNMKRLRSAYIGGESEGELTLTVKDDEDNSRDYPVTFLAHASRQGSSKVQIDRDGVGRYWQIKISNLFGAYFAIDTIELMVFVLGKKPR